MTNERTLIADSKILAAAYAPVPDPDRVIVPPFTRRDLGDLEAVSQRLDWLRSEMRAGITPSETIHGPTIHAVTQALKRLEAKAAAAAHVSTH